VWTPSLSIPERHFELTDVELARIKASIETWNSYGAAADRPWIEPLIKALFSERHVE